MGTFIFHPPVEIYNLDHRTGDVEKEKRGEREGETEGKECGCLKTDNPFQGLPMGRVLLCCAAYLFWGFFFPRKKLLRSPLAVPLAIGLWVKMTLTRTAFDLGEDRGYKLYRRTRRGGGASKWMSLCSNGPAGPWQSRLSIIWVTLIDSCSLWLLSRRKWPLQLRGFSTEALRGKGRFFFFSFSGEIFWVWSKSLLENCWGG